MNQEKIGNLIAKKRKEKEMTQDQLAQLLGVTNKAVSKWENGKSMPDLSIIQPLCAALDISVNELLNGEENSEKDEAMMHLLWLVKKLNKFRIIMIGLLLGNCAQLLESTRFIKEIPDETFLRGLADGVSAGMKIVSVCIFAYGVALYIRDSAKKY